MDINKFMESNTRDVRRNGDTTTAYLGCVFDASLESVWNACSNRDELRKWFAEVRGDLQAGATLTFDVGAPSVITSQLLQCQPLTRIFFTWSYPGREIDEIEIHFSRDAAGTLLQLEHRSNDKTDWWYGAGAGWEFALIRLCALLQGADPALISADEFDQKLGPLWLAAGAASSGK